MSPASVLDNDSALKINNMLFPHPTEDVFLIFRSSGTGNFSWRAVQILHYWTVIPAGNDAPSMISELDSTLLLRLPYRTVKRLCICHKSFMAVPMMMEAMKIMLNYSAPFRVSIRLTLTCRNMKRRIFAVEMHHSIYQQINSLTNMGLLHNIFATTTWNHCWILLTSYYLE